MAIYSVELFTSKVRATSVSFIFNGTGMIAGTIIQRFTDVPHAAASLGADLPAQSHRALVCAGNGSQGIANIRKIELRSCDSD